MLKNVIYTHKHHHACADAEAEQLAREFLEGTDEIYKTSSAIFITAIRTLSLEGIFPMDHILIHYHNQSIPLQEDGRIIYWPDGFCDFERKLFSRLFKELG